MEAQDFLRVINELDFILDDIDEISGQLDLTKAENNKMFQAISGIEKTKRILELNPDHDIILNLQKKYSENEKSKKILAELFPNIKSLDYEVREDLTAELMDS